MKIFIDSADLSEIKEAAALGCLDGCTTNPSLLAKVGRKIETAIPEIREIVAGPVSAEVVSTTYDEILPEGRKLAKLHKNVVVKVPLIPDGLRACKTLLKEGIRCNVTLCFSANQALLAAKAGAMFISPFLGRIDDGGHDGMELIQQISHDLRKLRLRDAGSRRERSSSGSRAPGGDARCPLARPCPSA